MARIKNINQQVMPTGKVTSNLGLTLLLLILALPFLGVSYLLNAELDTEAQFIARQKAGFDYVDTMRTLLEHVQQHRNIAYAHLNGAGEFESQLPALVARIDEDVLAVDRLHVALKSMPQTSNEWITWRKDWLTLQQQHVQLSPADNFDTHTVLIDELLSFIQEAIDVFHLVLDTQLDSRTLAEAVMQMPWQMENMSQAQGLGTGIVARGHISANNKVRLRALGQSISEGTNDLVHNMTVLFERNSSLQARLSPMLDGSIKSINHFLDMVLTQFTDATALDVSTRTYFSTGTTARDNFYRLFDAIESELDGLLMARLEDTQYKRMILQVSTLLVLVVTITIYFIFLRHQAALTESKQKIQAIVENAADSIVTINEQGLILSFNPAAEKIFGYSTDEIMGQNVSCLMPETDSSLHDGYLHRYMESGQGHIIGVGAREVEAQHHDGRILPMDLSISEMQQPDGTRLFIGILRDISRRKQADADLRASEERFTLITQGTRDGIWDWDLTTGQVYFSPRWKTMLGYDEADIEDNFLALQNLIHPDDLGTALDGWMACMEGETETFAIEYRLKNKQGSYTWIQCRGTGLRDDSGQPVRMAGSHTDISSKKQAFIVMEHMHNESQARAEALERSNQELEATHRELQASHEQLLQSEKLASIGQLAAGVAHEINNPVGYVYSNLGTLQKYIDNLFQMLEGYEQLEALVTDQDILQTVKTLKEKLDLEYLKEDVRDLVSESREGIARVKGIVQDLKDFSHVDEAEWQWADLHRGLDSTLNIVSNEIKYKAEVVREYGELPEVECLASQINQVFMNLLVNAAHAIEERGVITIRTGHENGKVWVAISDTGQGITPEHMKNIFDPFFTTKAVGTGTGLGLSLSYGIVQKHGGSISVDSDVGKGTTFTIHLPVKQPEVQAEKSDEVTG